MLSEITPDSREEWKKDIRQIKSLGFNSIKTWVEWSHCEPHKGQYNFENLRMVLESGQGSRIEGDYSGLWGICTGMGWKIIS